MRFAAPDARRLSGYSGAVCADVNETMHTLETIKAHPVFHFFYEICQIPHGSFNEKAISDYLVGFARSKGLWYTQDTSGNVIIRKPATAGYESAAPVILQSHMDMVCEKLTTSDHDFLRDPLKLELDGDWLRAAGTTLGADDGIGMAITLAMLDASDIPHPALEGVFTVNEEAGMDGARLLDTTLLSGRYLINIDMETEGKIVVSCAGGMRIKLSLPSEKTDAPTGLSYFELQIDNLTGGHSGTTIDRQRANANILLGRLLFELKNIYGIRLSSISGGSKENAIPKDARAVICVDPSNAAKLESAVETVRAIFANEHRMTDPDLTCVCRPCEASARVFSDDAFAKLTALLLDSPNGVLAMSLDIPGLVETSCNLGVVWEEDDRVCTLSAARSSVPSRKAYVIARLVALAESLGAETGFTGDYPAWPFVQSSRLRDIAAAVYAEQTGMQPLVTAIHAGLECGMFGERMPGLDMITIGPTITGTHTPIESLSVSSALRVWDMTREIVERLK